VTFNDFFKAAWLSQRSPPIIAPGDNFIPCVHVRDVARLVRVVASDTNVGSYLIAVDRSRMTQTQILQCIMGQMSKMEALQVVDAANVDTDFKDDMMLDLIMKPSAPLRSKTFPWWCKKGLVGDIAQLANEFCNWRNLQSIKVVIIGPPGSGAEKYCSWIDDKYLHGGLHLSFDGILQDALNNNNGVAKRLQRKMEAAASKGVVAPSKTIVKLRTKLVMKRLMSSVCRYRGYVLEGPTSYEEAEALFTKFSPDAENPEDSEDAEEDEEDFDDEGEGAEEEEDPSPDEEDDFDGPKPVRVLNAVAPEFVVELRSSEHRCKERIFAGQAGGAASEDEFVRKTALYKKNNLQEDGSPGTSDFFREVAKIKVSEHDVDAVEEDAIIQILCTYIESKGQFFNYLRSDEEINREKQLEIAQRELEDDERREQERREKRECEEALRAKRASEAASRVKMLAEGDASLLETEALPLRQYLMINVVPRVSEGLSEVCKVMPEDPIEYLAEYLFAHSREVPPLAEQSGFQIA